MHYRTRVLLATLSGFVIIGTTSRPAQAQRIATRADLLQALGSTARTETFDRPTGGGTQIVTASAVSTFDATTQIAGLGAGLIEPGIALSNQNNGHWFYPANYAWFGNPSGLYAGGHSTMDVRFTTPTRAFGADLWVFANQPIGTTISVFDFAGQLVSSTALPAAFKQFFGWQHDAGISRVQFTGGTNDALSVRLDDLTFGAGTVLPPPTTVPEPATLGLTAVGAALVGGAARWRARARG
jgi:hypothetical protein